MITVAQVLTILQDIDEKHYSLQLGFETEPETPVVFTLATQVEGSSYLSYDVPVIEVDLRDDQVATGFGVQFGNTWASNTFLERVAVLF
jgi:hypothetical protein